MARGMLSTAGETSRGRVCTAGVEVCCALSQLAAQLSQLAAQYGDL